MLLTLLPFSLYLASEAPDVDSIKRCSPFTDQHVPQNVHQLRADSIRVIMGLGDSSMAAFGAKPFSLLDGSPFIQEYRGHSFVMGGDRDAPSLANFLEWYRADLPEESKRGVVGASRGAHPIEICAGSFWCPPDALAYRPHQDQFNAALSGAQVSNLGLESKYLLQQVSKHPQVSLAEDWKLLTIFIGTNDLCQNSCKALNLDEMEEKLFQTLELVRSKLPRTLVLLLQVPDVSQLSWFANRHKRCAPVQALMHLECPCAMGSSDDQWALRTTTAAYNQRLERVAQRVTERIWQDQPDASKQDWAVVSIPMLRDTSLRDDIPHHFATKLDCFHPSMTAHRSMAMALWRQLFQPAANRTSHLREQQEIYCPLATDFIRTD